MLAPITPGDDPRLAQLLARLPDLGVPVLPLDYERVARVFTPGGEMGWEAARELLVSLLAKDESQRHIVRREFRRQIPPLQEQAPIASASEPGAATPLPTAPDAERHAAPSADPQRTAARRNKGIVRTAAQRRWPVWRLTLAATLLATLATVLIAWLWLGAEPPSLPAPPPPTSAADTPAPDALPAVPVPYFHDWVPIIEPLHPAAALVAWLPPLALLLGGMLGAAWLWERARALREPGYTQVDFDPDAEAVLTWSPKDLRLPALLSATQRREMVWGVQRFESEHFTPVLDVPTTVRACAEAGLPELRFARAGYEREVWLWLDSRLRTREAVALAEQIEHDLSRAGLRVRRATFPAVPVKIRFATRERASPLDLGSAARQALVALFTDGSAIADTLQDADGDQAAQLQRILRELRTWPRFCLVDFSTAQLDLPALATRHGLACIDPDRLPAWLAERAIPQVAEELPSTGDFARHLWAAACALVHLPVTAAQARALHQALGLPPALRLPAPAHGHAGADGIRFSEAERHRLLADLARWVWEDGRDSEAADCLRRALAFWEVRLAENTVTMRQLAAKQIAGSAPGASEWEGGGADHTQRIERHLLGLWHGDIRTTQAVLALWDLHTLYADNDREDLQTLGRLLRARLGALSAQGLGDEGADGRIRLPWSWLRLPDLPGDPRGTARERLLRMGFGGAEPGGRKRLGADARVLVGAFAGIALAGLVGLGKRYATLDDTAISHDAAVYDSPLFQRLVTEKTHGGRLHAASRKLAVARELLPDAANLRVHWCWSGLAADRAAEPCRAIYQELTDSRRLNVLPLGDSALLRAGSLAEPIRACAARWPQLSVAVIAADPWRWPQEPDNNLAARRLAIRLLDSGAVDLALIGPAQSNPAAALAREWAFVPDSQWLFFSRLPEQPSWWAMAPALGAHSAHSALIFADYEKLAIHLRDKVSGVLDPTDPRERLTPDVARILPGAGNPRLWGGPEVIAGPAGIELVRVCPGTFTMGSPPAGADTPENLRPYDDELPAHPVILGGFEIARTELTGWQYARIIGKTQPAGPEEPVAAIDWNDARALCRRIEPNGDLPTEAQWEYAARGGAQTAWSWGNDAARAGDYAWYSGNNANWRAHRAGDKLPNPLGLYDMHGNLWEWVRDCWNSKAYAGQGPHPTLEPREDGAGCSARVLRGGSFGGEPRLLRSADRSRRQPGLRGGSIGLRCVRGSVRQLDN